MTPLERMQSMQPYHNSYEGTPAHLQDKAKQLCWEYNQTSPQACEKSPSYQRHPVKRGLLSTILYRLWRIVSCLPEKVYTRSKTRQLFRSQLPTRFIRRQRPLFQCFQHILLLFGQRFLYVNLSLNHGWLSFLHLSLFSPIILPCSLPLNSSRRKLQKEDST